MPVCSKTFFENLRVDVRYYTNIFLNIGVKSPFIFDKDDLILISELPVYRYKTALVSHRAKSLLEASQCQN